MARVSSQQPLTILNQGSLSTMHGPETRLKLFPKAMIFGVLMELFGNCTFKELYNERKIRDGPIVLIAAPDLFKIGVIAAVLRDRGTVPKESEEFIICTNRGRGQVGRP